MDYRRIERIKHRLKRNHERIDKMRFGRLKLPFSQFVMLMPFMTEETIKSLIFVPTPKVFCKVDIPQDLQLATFGTLTELQHSPIKDDYLQTCCKLVSVLTGIEAEVVAKCKAIEVLGIVNMIQREMERIGKLFSSLHSDKSSEEIAAGIDKLEFGTFGLVDWYAQRMGIIDHEDVFKTPWARIFQCAKIDHENNEFEKRYRKIIENKNKLKK